MAKYKQLEVTEKKVLTYMVEIEAEDDAEMEAKMAEIKSGSHPTNYGTVYDEQAEEYEEGFTFEEVGESDESEI